MHPCDFCSKCYPWPKLLHQHVQSVHYDVMPICDLCCKSFPDVKSLEKHKRTHHARLDVPCSVCGFVVPEDTLDSHVLKYHPLVLDWVCDACGQEFREVGDFRSHIEGCSDERGTDEEPRSCRLVQCFSCDKTFSRDREFLQHRDHCGYREEIGNCEECAVPFYTYVEMLKHEGNCRVPTLERVIQKRHECKICASDNYYITFHREKYLRKHQENVHDVENPEIPCFECDRIFTSYSKLLFHVESVHDVGSESDQE